jgi:glucoamylase
MQQALPDQQALRALAGRAYQRLLRNLTPEGAVVGSPARGREPGQPNYWFYWQRDGAVTMGHLIDWHQRPPLGLDTHDLAAPIERWLGFVAETQRQGYLGTSRYEVNGQRVGGYGNPQLDGPAHSALALCRLREPARGWKQLRRYLDFLLTAEGRGPTMDAWEFIYGRLLNAELLRRRALLAGARVARNLGHDSDADHYEAEARTVYTRLADFVQRGRLVAYRETYNPWFGTISGLDMAVISALLAGATPERNGEVGLGRTLDSLAHPALLATMMEVEDAFEPLYQINRDWRSGGNDGCGLGRFPEDANDGVESSGGNPWPLATLWGGQFYYALSKEVDDALDGSASAVTLDDPRSVAFFNRAAGADITSQGQPLDAAVWRERLLPALLRRGDAFLSFVVHHVPDDGAATEQIDRDTGEPRGARDLSWALSELIATVAMREDVHSVP